MSIIAVSTSLHGSEFVPYPRKGVILTDIDDTVLHYIAPFEAWCRASGIPLLGSIAELRSVEAALGVTHDEAVAIMQRFAAEGGLAAQPAMKDAVNVLWRLRRAGYAFVGVTACGLDPTFQRARKALLEATFGFTWDALHVVDLGASKASVLNAYDPAIWVEDHHGHAIVGGGLGHTAILLDRPYNRHLGDHPNFRRLAGWREIAAMLDVRIT